MILIRSNYCCWSIIYIYRNHCVSFCWCYFSLWINLRKKNFFFRCSRRKFIISKCMFFKLFSFLSLSICLSLHQITNICPRVCVCSISEGRIIIIFFSFLIIEFLFIHQSIFIIYELRRISSMFVIYKWLKWYGVFLKTRSRFYVRNRSNKKKSSSSISTLSIYVKTWFWWTKLYRFFCGKKNDIGINLHTNINSFILVYMHPIYATL